MCETGLRMGFSQTSRETKVDRIIFELKAGLRQPHRIAQEKSAGTQGWSFWQTCRCSKLGAQQDKEQSECEAVFHKFTNGPGTRQGGQWL